MAFSPDGSIAYVTNVVNGTVSVISLVLITLISAAHARKEARHLTTSETAVLVKREFQHLAGDVRETWKLIRTHHDLRFVFATVVPLAMLFSFPSSP